MRMHRAVVCVLSSILFLACATPGSGTKPASATWAIQVRVRAQRAVAVEDSRTKPDPISDVTVQRTALLLDPTTDPRARFGHLRVRLLDAQGTPLYTQFVRDVMSDAIEVPPGLDANGDYDQVNQPQRWLTGHRPAENVLFAVPVRDAARWIEFTRYEPGGGEIDAGRVELEAEGRSERSGRDGSAGAGPGPSASTTPPPRRRAYAVADAEHATVIDNGPSADLFDLLILADGYLDTNAQRDRFRDDVNRALAFLWTLPTYFELRAGMNVHVAFVPSVDAGAGDGPGSLKDTPFESYFNCDGIARLVCLGATGEAFANTVALDAPGNYGAGTLDSIAVLTSDARYGGGGGAVLTFSSDAQSPEIFAHEFGHTVVDLADEYETAYPSLVVSSRTKANISGDIASPADLKWSALVGPGTAIPTQTDPGGCERDSSCSNSTLPAGTAGMYEGGGYVACDSFRPTTECLMRCLDRELCPVCRQAFLDTLSGGLPTLDVYVRDNALDVGNPPSPVDVEDPPGSGKLVKPWHSVDILVDAPPFGPVGSPGPHENPLAGETNRVFVTVHNRGTSAAAAATTIELFHAGATGGAPPFPGVSWTSLGTENANVPGAEGEDTVFFDWAVPVGTPSHTCVLGRIDTAGDAAPAPAGSLSAWVRSSNNVTWKNLHVSDVTKISGVISNFSEQRPIVFRIETPDVPVGTRVLLEVGPGLILDEFDPTDPRQMTITSRVGNTFELRRDDAAQTWFSLITDVPGGSARAPFEEPFTLDLSPPGGTPVGTTYTVSVDQYDVERATGIVGAVIGGNTYTMTLD